MVKKAMRQPKWMAMGVMIKGAISDPTAAPLLKMPLPNPRSAGGIRSAMIRVAQGQLKASPTPSTARVISNCLPPEMNAAAAPAADHRPTAAA